MNVLSLESRGEERKAKQANTGLECVLAKHVAPQALNVGPYLDNRAGSSTKSDPEESRGITNNKHGSKCSHRKKRAHNWMFFFCVSKKE